MSNVPAHIKKRSAKYQKGVPTLLFLMVLLFFQLACSAQVQEPYRQLHGGRYGAPVAASPDPLAGYRWPAPGAKDSLQVYTVYPVSISASPTRNFEQNNDEIAIKDTGELFFDFGMENAAWLEFDSDDLVDSVTASISEYNEPAIVNTGAAHRFKTFTPAKYGNTYRLELNKELYEGVRFAWIHIKKITKTAHIKNVRLICQAKPVNYQGRFSCSDSMLTRIWYTGAYTVRLNLLQDYFGDILMERSDRHSWTGDAYPAQAAALVAFGNYDMIRQNLNFTSSQDNGIIAYSLYWVLSLIDYYNYTGDSAFIKTFTGNVDNRLQSAFDSYDSLPPLNFMGWDERLGGGFENPQTLEGQRTYRMLCIGVWSKAANLMHSIGENTLARKYQQFADAKIKSLLSDKKAFSQFGVHSVSQAINAGLGENTTLKKMAAMMYADRLNRLSYSAFNEYFILQAMSGQQYYQEALTAVKDLWGGQIAYGGTSFFEVYRPSWNNILAKNDPPPNNQCGYTSLCHPWSAGVTKWLSENIAGIRPLSPGFKRFEIVPYLNDDLGWVKGSTPTPSGTITAEFNSRTGRCLVIIPNGTFAEKVALPKVGRKINKIRVNGQLLFDKAFHKVEGIADMEDGEDYINLTGLKPGKYVIQLTYGGRAASSYSLPVSFHYVINDVRQDSLTSGQWTGKYGHRGYLLLGYPKIMSSARAAAEKRPEAVSSITLKMDKTLRWDSVMDSGWRNHVLQPPGIDTLIAAAVATEDPLATRQTMTIDVQLKENHPYTISVYFLDGNKQDRRSAMEIFDLKTLNILAPVIMIKHYEKGRYISFSYNKSFRIRINQVRGENAVVSGLFFDDPATFGNPKNSGR